jgi:primosomal protein N' (replication factor Y) (superfamily II helicase)
MIAKVLPLTTTRALAHAFDYRVPDGGEEVKIGSLLRIPFANRSLLGVVAELADSSELPDERLATAEQVLPARLPPDLVELAIWIAREYCSTPARALQAMLPAGATRGLTEREILVAGATAAGIAALTDGTRLTGSQRAALAALAERREAPARELGTSLLRRLEGRGLVTIGAATSARRPARHQVSAAPAAAPGLTGEQRTALAPILAELTALADRTAPGREPVGDQSEPPRFLLHGVTGSGKTEVYLAAAQAALAAGRTVLILVPEIALTPQALARFEARFGDVVAVLHSGMPDGQRHDEWLRLARGEATVCVGPRSAVFAPLADIGLIVVDEEHESSYKHEGDPRYDARTVAEQRARRHGAVLLAGSATPRPESIPRHARLRLASRVDGRPLPAVEILDMRGQHHPLHPETRLALSDVKRERGKAIVLLNRRGWSNFLSCGDCGRVWTCPNCDVALVLHRASRSVACHHCGHRQGVPTRCPDCGSVSVSRHGAGTERLEHELFSVLGEDSFPILRLDADSAGIEARAQILERFAAIPAGVLVGTQMVAKGHDFAGIRLGVVLDADQTLRFPDFRAEERTFALVTQLAGRTGRGGSGRVLVQTMAPGARPIVLAARHQSERFLEGELERREALGYPPYRTLIRVVCAAVDGDHTAATAARLREAIDPPDAAVLGPAPLFTLRGRARSQLVVKAERRAEAIAAVGGAVDRVSRDRASKGVAISVDVDPQ